MGIKIITALAIHLARDNLTGLVSNLASNAINILKKKEKSGKGVVGARKGFNLFILNKDVNSVIGNKKSLEDLGVLIDKITEAVKHEIKKTRRQISWRFFLTFSRFNSATSDFFSSKIYKWKRI